MSFEALVREEMQLSRIRSRIRLKKDLNPMATGALNETGLMVARPETLRVKSVPSGIHVEWTPVASRNVRYYEVQVGQDPQFGDSAIYRTTDPNYTAPFQGEEPNWIRVRVVGLDGRSGAFSDVLNSVTGLVGMLDITDGAITGFYETEISTFDSTHNVILPSAQNEAWWEASSTYETEGGLILPFVEFNVDMIVGVFTGTEDVTFIEASVVFDRVSTGDSFVISPIGSVALNPAETTFTNLGTPTIIAPGEYFMGVHVVGFAGGGSVFFITPLRLRFYVVELKT